MFTEHHPNISSSKKSTVQNNLNHQNIQILLKYSTLSFHSPPGSGSSARPGLKGALLGRLGGRVRGFSGMRAWLGAGGPSRYAPCARQYLPVSARRTGATCVSQQSKPGSSPAESSPGADPEGAPLLPTPPSPCHSSHSDGVSDENPKPSSRP